MRIYIASAAAIGPAVGEASIMTNTTPHFETSRDVLAAGYRFATGQHPITEHRGFELRSVDVTKGVDPAGVILRGHDYRIVPFQASWTPANPVPAHILAAISELRGSLATRVLMGTNSKFLAARGIASLSFPVYAPEILAQDIERIKREIDALLDGGEPASAAA